MGHGSGCFGFLSKKKAKRGAKPSSKNVSASNVVNDGLPSAPKGEPRQDLVPSKGEYAIEATKRTLEILTGVAGLVGIPLVKEVLEIGVSILTTCETINEVQGKVKELKNRMASYLLIIAKVAKDPETDPIMKSSQSLMDELQELKDCLAGITIRLGAISQQNIVLTTLLPQANTATIEECVGQFQDAIARFQTLRGIHAAQDLSRLQNQVEEVYQLARVAVEKMDQVQTSVDKLREMLESAGAQSDSFAFSSKIPPIPDNFLGRDAVVDRIAGYLASGNKNDSRVCILGPGGMGKTSAALAIVDHAVIKAKFPPKNRLWIPCISLTSPSAFLAFLARRLGISGQADPLQSIISTLEHGDTPYIVVLDNFETPWHPIEGAQKFTKEILQALDDIPNLSILVTMRARLPPLAHWKAENLDVLPLEDCRRIYTAIEPQAAHTASEDLDNLLETIGRLPYAVTLMANQAKHSDASPAELLFEWHKVGSKMLAEVEDPSKGMDSSIELSVKSKYVASSPGALEQLQVLSMLPAGVYREDISIWLKSWSLAALSTLRNAALIVSREVELEGTKKTHYLVLPVIQSYMQHPGRIPHEIRQATYDACFAFLRSHKSIIEGPNDPGFKDAVAAIIAHESNLQAILMEVFQHSREQATPATTSTASPSPNPTSEHLDALLIFVAFQGFVRPRVELAEKLVLLAAQEAPGTLIEAHALFRLSCIRHHLDQYASTAEGYQKARDLFLRHNMPLKACIADWSILECTLVTGQVSYKEQRDLVKETRSRWESYMGGPLVEVRVLFNASQCMPSTYLDADSERLPPGILEDLMKARDICLARNNAPQYLVNCLLSLAGIHLQARQAEEAHAFAKEAIELSQRAGLPDTGMNHISLIYCLKALDHHGPELFGALQDGLKSARTYGSPLHVSFVLELLAAFYVKEHDWAAARLACEETIKETMKGSGRCIEAVRRRAESNLRYLRESKDVGFEDGSDIQFLEPPGY